MPRECELTDFERGQIIGLWKSGKSTREITKILGFSQSQVFRAISTFRDKGQTTVAPRSGRPKSLKERDLRYLKRTVQKNRHKPLEEITEMFNQNSTNPVSADTVRRYLHEEGFYSRIALRKPFVSEENRKKRFKWCVDRKSWNQEWKYIIWSDESRFNLYENDGRQRVWRQPKEKYDIECLVPTFKHGGGGIMVWGCFVNNLLGPLVVIEGNINAKSYIDLLNQHLLPFLSNLERPNEYTFQDDNATVHRARVVTKWKEENLLSSLSWPAQSPDLNPIEHAWDKLERAVRTRKLHPRTIEELSIYLKEEWLKIDPNYLQKLVESVPRRVEAVIQKKGNSTNY